MKMWKQCDHVKEVARCDEPPEIYSLSLKLPSALWSFILSFNSLFFCPVQNFTVWLTDCSHSFVFSRSRQLFLSEKSSKNPLYA